METDPATQGSPADRLLRLVQTGRLFDLQKWIAEENPTDLLEQGKRSALLSAAVKTGFHSVVELLLKSTTWSVEDMVRGLEEAFWQRRDDLAELLIESGAPIRGVDFEDVCVAMHVPLMEKFLLAGGDPGSQNAFARALSRTKAKPLLGFYKRMRNEYPALDDQAALALHQAVVDNSVRWVCLLIWAGADAFRKVPPGLDGDWGDEMNMTTAALEACWSRNEALLPAMKLKPSRAQALELCRSIVYTPSVEKFEKLLRDFTPAELNGGGNDSCEILESLVGHHVIEFTGYSNKHPQRLPCIEWLLKHGAKWNPSMKSVADARRGLGGNDALYVVSVIRLLLYTPGAAAFETIWELCRTPKMKSLIITGDNHLWREIWEMRGSQ